MISQVGAGKSSLLGAILGEMRCVRGKSRMDGSVAYATQVYFVQPIVVFKFLAPGNHCSRILISNFYGP